MKKHQFTSLEALLLCGLCGLLLGLVTFAPLARLIFDSGVAMKFVDAWVIYAFISESGFLGVCLCWVVMKWRPHGGWITIVALASLCLIGLASGLWVRVHKGANAISQIEGATLMLLAPGFTITILLTLAVTRCPKDYRPQSNIAKCK